MDITRRGNKERGENLWYVVQALFVLNEACQASGRKGAMFLAPNPLLKLVDILCDK